MASKHTFLLDLPDVLEALGLNVWVADGYEYGQGNYLWTNPHTNVGSYNEKPFGYMVHHSASSSANPPPSDTSKASAWIGLLRDGKLYQEGGGVPTIYLASAGPARISSGYGYRPAAWDYTFEERRSPAKAEGADGDTALNRYSFNMETVHRGDGPSLDPDVFDHVVGLGIALEQMCELEEMTLGHRSWTTRKIDPYWNNDPNCIIMVQNRVADGGVMDPTCPWTSGSDYPACSAHYTPTSNHSSGRGDGEAQGQCHVPDSQHAAVDWAFETGRFRIGNSYRYDYTTVLTEGREMVFEYRDAT